MQIIGGNNMDGKLEDKLNGNFMSIKARTYLAAAVVALGMIGYGCGTTGSSGGSSTYSREPREYGGGVDRSDPSYGGKNSGPEGPPSRESSGSGRERCGGKGC